MTILDLILINMRITACLLAYVVMQSGRCLRRNALLPSSGNYDNSCKILGNVKFRVDGKVSRHISQNLNDHS
jgi:hypothetical protein